LSVDVGESGFEVVLEVVVATVNIAALQSPTEESAVRVFDDFVDDFVGALGVFVKHFFDAEQRAVGGGAGFVVGDDFAVAVFEVGADDDADVVEFEALAGVDASDFVD